MSKWGKVDYKQLKKFQDKLQKLNDMQQEFCEAAAKELAARLLAKAIQRTPVGKPPKLGAKSAKVTGASGKQKSFLTKDGVIYQQHWAGYTGGTLRRGWTSKTPEEAANGSGKPTAKDGTAYAQTLPVKRVGDSFVIDVINPVEWATYVEYGHIQTPGRYVPALGKKLKKGWVQGKFMLTISVDEIQKSAPKILEKKLAKWLGEHLNGK